jgi:REP element-mobilizing transposase RayT
MSSPPPLEFNHYYHIYNRGNNRENIFKEERNYRHFLKLYVKYIEPIADTFAYCLLPNHFHLLVRIKAEEEQAIRETFEVSETSKVLADETSKVLAGETSKVLEPQQQTLKVSGKPLGLHTFRVLKPSQQFSNLFNAYTKAVNNAYQRTGSLFEHPFGRIPVTSETYFVQLITYIHQNPQKHGLIDDFRDWPYSSYSALFSDKPTRVKREEVLTWFDGASNAARLHQQSVDEGLIAPLIIEDFD